ncbi:hypothetical protein BCR42DRAFT_402618 [Absidia repens]|uniref:HCP-like protein n=1 Tax=Absidia repens TaxID=90262 RepID=A0A1X2IYC4_9FUNG|nr:hypothetical protein BCR42DRAFT_402618 [Absidia repens]
MASLQQALDGVPATLHCHKVIELLQSPSIKPNTALFNHAIQYLRIKAIKGDVEAKVKLGTILDGQLMAIVAASQGDQGSLELWQDVLDKAEADLWGKSLFDRGLALAMTPCYGLVESDLLLRQKANNNTGKNDSGGLNETSKCFRLVSAILSHADRNDMATGDISDDSNAQPTKQQKDDNKLKADMCIGLQKDLQQAVEYFRKASKLNHDGANYQLATIMEDYYNYPDFYDMEKSVALYEKMVAGKKKKKTGSNGNSGSTATPMNHSLATLSASDAKALMKLARVYYEGDRQGESKNMEKAYQYARKVAESKGEKYCQFMVGDILLQQNDTQQSLFWLAQSGEQGFPLAIEALARVYFEGVPPNVKQDYELAYEWCLKGDDIWPSGLGYCQSCLGDMYRQGLGVPKDQMKSFEYYQKAASQQDSPQNYARYMLGEMFYHGDGWIQNIPVAKDYYQIAANEKYVPAQQRLVEIETHEHQKRERELASQKSNKPWRIMSLFGGRRKVPG